MDMYDARFIRGVKQGQREAKQWFMERLASYLPMGGQVERIVADIMNDLEKEWEAK